MWRIQVLMSRVIWLLICVHSTSQASFAQFDADVVDVWLSPSNVNTGQTADVYSRFKNLSDPNGPYGGAATFDIRIIVQRPSGSSSYSYIDNWAFDYSGQEKNAYWDDYYFSEEGTYTITGEIYDVNGYQSGWASSHRFDWRTETFTLTEPNYPPTSSRDQPTAGTVDIYVGNSITFRVRGSDSNCNLYGVDWYLDGQPTGDTDSLSGCSDTATHPETFNNVGTYIVEADVFDDQFVYNSSAAKWTINVNPIPNDRPASSRDDPTDENVNVFVGQSVTFRVRATDADCNLYGVDWYLDGQPTGDTDSLSGCSDTAKHPETFNNVGTYIVEADVFDDQFVYNSSAARWIVQVDAPSGSLDVVVNNEDGQVQQGVTCNLFDGNYNYLGSQWDRVTNSNGIAQWDALPIGEYWIEAYFEGANPFDTTGELWTVAMTSVTTGPNSITIQRDWPYAESFRIVRESDNWVVPSTESIAPQSEGGPNSLRMEVVVRNSTDESKQARVLIILDRDFIEPWDYQSPWPSQYVTIPANNTATLTIEGFEPPTDQGGNYSKAVYLEVEGVGKTDAWNWANAFDLLNLPSNKPSTSPSVNVFGITWKKIDWAWKHGLYSGNAFVQNDEILLRLDEGSGVGAKIQAQGDEYHYGDYTATILVPAATLCPQGATQGFFYYLDGHGEIDVEILSRDPGYVHFVVWKDTIQRHWFRVPDPNQGNEYQNYGFRWRENQIEFLLNGTIAQGVQIPINTPPCANWPSGKTVPAVVTSFVPSQPGQLILNHWSGNPNWSGYAPKGTGDRDMKISDISYDPLNPTSTCLADLNDDTIVNVDDLLLLVGQWGQSTAWADLNDNGVVNVDDLLELIGAWGPC